MPPDETRHDEVLAQLDAAQEDYLLTGPGNANYPAAAFRMDAYSSDEEWILALQMLAWHRVGARFVLDLQVFGNDVSEDLGNVQTEVIRAVPGERLFGDSSDDLLLDLHDFTVLIGDEQVHLELSDADYEAAGIDLEAMAPPLAFLRILAARAGDKLLLSGGQLLDTLDKRGLKHLFTIDEWRHPDEAEDELPSSMDCFRQIAQIIADQAERQPESCAEGSNTHWSHWLDYER
jgi:hypothetical protein